MARLGRLERAARKARKLEAKRKQDRRRKVAAVIAENAKIDLPARSDCATMLSNEAIWRRTVSTKIDWAHRDKAWGYAHV